MMRYPQGRAVGLEAIDAIHLMENHDRAYRLWKETGFKERILVHIDAHHDMWWTDDLRSLSIANFICPALKENIVREVYWVVPDATWDSHSSRAALRRHLQKILDRYPGDRAAIRWERRRIRTSVLGRALVVCSLDSLPRPGEPVLLDIDTDYLMIPQVSYGEWDTHSPLPWRWPSELVELLRAREIGTDFVTIAYSVEGGYTPLHWKYLGGELAFRLRRPDGGDALEPYERMREGTTAQLEGDGARAEAAFRAVGDRLGAAPYSCLAHLMADHGRTEEGRDFYRRALTLDPSYRADFSSPGVSLYFARSYAAAERAFRRTLLLDPADASAHLGLGWIAAHRRRWALAEQHARASLARRPDLIDAHCVLAKALAKQDRLDEALQSYEQSLKLGLAGHRPFDGVIATDPERGRMLDSGHGRTHALLAALYERKGDRKRAIVGYKIAVETGGDSASVRLRLARLYARQHMWSDARQHAIVGLKRTPKAAKVRFARVRHRARTLWTARRKTV
jgi:tetratricopeptide (TPR) repeat protein